MLVATPPVIGREDEKPSKPADPNAFSSRVYRLPAQELSDTFLSNEIGELRAPMLPDATARSSEIEIFIKRSHEVMNAYLGQQGIKLPKGSIACFDPATGTLALRAPNIIHEIVAPFANALERTQPKNVTWSLSILETQTSFAREAMKEATGISDHTGVLERLLPRSKVVVSMRGDTKPGFETKSVQGAKVDDLLGYSLDDKNHVRSLREETMTGTELELETSTFDEEQELELILELRHRHMPGTPRLEKSITIRSEKVQAHWMDRPLAAMKTAIMMNSGTTKLLGTWSLDGDALPEHADLVRVAFIRASIVYTQPLDDGRVKRILDAHGEAVEPTPKQGSSLANSDQSRGMSVRRFRVPPDFLSLGGEATPIQPPDDPFAPATANGSRPKRRKTAEEILHSQGIQFPPGALATFNERSSELVVCNTEANLNLLETFHCCWNFKPKLLSFSLHIVQADASLIRKLDRETCGQPDHSAAWKEVDGAVAKGAAKIVRSAWIETTSGYPSTTESILEFRHFDSSNKSSSAHKTETAHKPDDAPSKNTPVATSPVPNKTAGHGHEITSTIQPCGLRFELEPTLEADNSTVDLNLSLTYDYAPPAQRLFDEPLPEHTIGIAAPATEFRRHEFKTSITTRSGATRLLSIWKPSGTPELDGDVLQAAFIRADVVTVKPDEK